jgi:hypothetical protein
MKRATRGRNRAVAIHQVFFVERLQAGKLGKIHDKPAINNSNQQARSRVTKPPANGSNTAAVSARASYCSAAAIIHERQVSQAWCEERSNHLVDLFAVGRGASDNAREWCSA